jgi:hypothetical protein
MRAVVIYESMFGSTKSVAEAVSHGLATHRETAVIRAADAGREDFSDAGLLVIGAPTHLRGLPRPSTRSGTPEYVRRSRGLLVLEPDADTVPGVREWLSRLDALDITMPFACFDTRASGPAFITGRASKSIARSLKRHHVTPLTAPESFRTSGNRLMAGEYERAVAWGRSLGSRVLESSEHAPTS